MVKASSPEGRRASADLRGIILTSWTYKRKDLYLISSVKRNCSFIYVFCITIFPVPIVRQVEHLSLNKRREDYVPSRN